jgi:hypothetical protein
MYIRSKVAKGSIYYQIVEGYRDPDDRSQVRQRVVLALGREPDPAVVLDDRRRTIRELKRQEARYDNPKTEPLSKAQERHRQSVRDRIGKLEAFVRTLADLIKRGLIGTT